MFDLDEATAACSHLSLNHDSSSTNSTSDMAPRNLTLGLPPSLALASMQSPASDMSIELASPPYEGAPGSALGAVSRAARWSMATSHSSVAAAPPPPQARSLLTSGRHLWRDCKASRSMMRASGGGLAKVRQVTLV